MAAATVTSQSTIVRQGCGIRLWHRWLDSVHRASAEVTHHTDLGASVDALQKKVAAFRVR
jgi:hypothetical protein